MSNCEGNSLLNSCRAMSRLLFILLAEQWECCFHYFLFSLVSFGTTMGVRRSILRKILAKIQLVIESSSWQNVSTVMVCMKKKIPFWQYVILQLELWHPKLSWYQNLLINIFLTKIGRYCRLLMCRLWCQSDSWQTDFFSSLTEMKKKGGQFFT